ncbi:Glyoxylase, beta-lactamase superfamily II [Cribrihabitans marinus]|uniref:Glyoxylase, beta-lactamase superfamily II n=1 Tax=Cribrihabitans marinus TaxID=1227549 RepID=A0A1H7CWD7_9RHOB|nr:MBL fold metallo-hydrolase [Cribrihabitans marinus]GGH35834.1 MBL fold hydrolase [Cribrihabitans marinus]SEJ90155.1 Glyoxylase, beta-lactamase superfamily II [Cribrihabitans marinus]
MTVKITRRTALAGAAALPLAGAATSTHAASHAAAAPSVAARRFALGDMSVTALLDGSFAREGVKDIFGGGASDADFTRVSEENFIPADSAQFYFTPTLVDTGGELVLFDTGLGQGGIQTALNEVGVSPDDINVVVLTHMHPDHIGGLMTEGAPTFANARYVTAAQEYDFWSGMEAGNRVGDLVASNVTPLADKTSFIEDGGAVAPGVTAMAAFGHTPGHMAYMLESGGKQMVLIADLANHYVWSFAHPEWEVSFDTDKAMATESRRRILGMLAADKLPMLGYHMPFPAAGFVDTRGEGFRFVPVSYQLNG